MITELQAKQAMYMVHFLVTADWSFKSFFTAGEIKCCHGYWKQKRAQRVQTRR